MNSISAHTSNQSCDYSAGDLLLGTDLVYIPRLQESYRRYGSSFFLKLLRETELAYCEGSAEAGKAGKVRESVMIKKAAGRIAVKEAVSKALGCGLNGLGWVQGVQWKDIEIVSQVQSPPALLLHGRALDLSTNLGVRAWRLSLSHDGDYAMATVVGLI